MARPSPAGLGAFLLFGQNLKPLPPGVWLAPLTALVPIVKPTTT